MLHFISNLQALRTTALALATESALVGPRFLGDGIIALKEYLFPALKLLGTLAVALGDIALVHALVVVHEIGRNIHSEFTRHTILTGRTPDRTCL
jgi:hypothetical protein